MLTRFIARNIPRAASFATYSNRANPPKSQSFMDMEAQFGCHNYKPLPVVITRGEGMFLWDVEGKQYYDFLAAYSAVNQGHCHPKILKTLKSQAKKLTLTSRAFYNDQLGPTEKFLSELFGYEKTLMMNGGVEACESAIKLARRWAYVKKGVPDNQAKILFAKGNFWGRTIAACGSSDDPDRFYRFGPFGGLGFEMVEYDDINAIEEKFKKDPHFAAVMLEPIQGEAGVIIPKPGYLRKVRELCTKYNVLFIADEVQTGLGRCGKMLAVEWDGVKPDILCLGKALSGGFLPISATLANDNVMMNIKPGEHGSTYGGNPLAAAIAKKSLEVILDEKLVDNSLKMGHRLQENLKSFKRDWIKEIRGKGLFIAVELHENEKKTAWDLCMKLMEAGILSKPTHGTKIRFSPPLIIDDKQLADCSEIIKKVFDNF